jgi:serine/threonine protein kinase/WD40 repeat protein
MSEGEAPLAEDRLTALLAKYSEALTAGKDEEMPTDPGLPSREAEQLRRAMDCLRRLHRRAPDVRPTLAVPPGKPGPSVVPPGQVGRFRIRRTLGHGGGGIVFLASDPELKREVALKVPRLETMLSDELRERFVRETRAMAALNHPNLVPIYEVGEAAGLVYLVTAYCSGPDLAKWLRARSEPVPLRTAAALLADLAEAVHFVHQHGILHRDLKPANVLLDPAEGPGTVEGLGFVPRLTDFGLAKLADGETRVTPSGAALGTPEYMAPEQAEGRLCAIGPVTDVWGLGAILYELLTGQPPFHGTTIADTLRRVVSEEPSSPRTLRADVPADLETICLKCLHKEQARRYGSAAELAAELRRYLSGEPIQARPVGALEKGWLWCRRSPSRAALWAVAVLLLVGMPPLALWYSSSLEQARAQKLLAQTTARADREARAAAEETGRIKDAFARFNSVQQRNTQRRTGWTWNGLTDLQTLADQGDVLGRAALRSAAAECLGAVDLRQVRAVAPGSTAGALAYAPDGRYLAVGADRAAAWASCQVRLVDPATGETVRELSFRPDLAWQAVNKAQDGTRALAFSPDGRWLIAGARSGRLHRWDLHQSRPEATSWAAHQQALVGLVFAPDGSALFSSSTDRSLKRWDLPNWTESGRFETAGWMGSVVVNPTGEWIACLGDDRLHLRDAGTLAEYRPASNARGEPLALRRDGRLFLLTEREQLLVVDAVSGGEVRRLRTAHGEAAHDAHITDLAFSPDGALAASVAGSIGQVRLWDLASGQLVAEATVAEGPTRLAFAPDGRSLAVTSLGRVLLFEVGGRREQTVALVHPGLVDSVAWAPDGKALVCLARDRETSAEVSVWQVDETGEPGLAPAARWWLNLMTEPWSAPVAVHPDGKWIAVPRQGEVYLWDVAGRMVPQPLPVPSSGILRFGPAGRLWTATGTKVHVWEVSPPGHVFTWSNAVQATLTGRGNIEALAVGRRWSLAGDRYGRVHRLNSATGDEVAGGPSLNGAIHALALHACEELAAAGSETGELRLFRVADGKVLAETAVHAGGIAALAFLAPDLLVSAARDRTVRVWRVERDALVELLALPAGGVVQSLAPSPDGARLALVIHGERGVRLWHLDRLRDRLADLGLGSGLPGEFGPNPGHKPAELRLWKMPLR